MVGGVDSFCCAYGCEVAVALISEHYVLGVQTAEGCRYGGRTSVGCFNPVYIYIVVGKYGATDRRNADSLVFYAHFVDQFGEYAVYYSVAASRTVMSVALIQKSRALIYYRSVFDDFFAVHLTVILWLRENV